MKPQSFKNLKKSCVWMVALLVSSTPAWAATLTVTTTADSGPGSLRAAIAAANSGDSIGFADAMANQTIHLTSGPLVIGKRVFIDDTGIGGVAVDGGGQGGQDTAVFVITNSANVDFFDITVTNGNNFAASGYGGGIDVDSGSLVLFGCIVTGNTAANNGGGIYCNSNAAIYLENGCVVSGNSCDGLGGGICASIGSTVSILDTTVSGNTSELGGNGIALLYATTATLADSTISRNLELSASVLAGGIYNESCTLTISNCVLFGNTASNGDGGAVNNVNSATATLINCTLSNNIADTGGAIWNEEGSILIMTNCTISGNPATGITGGGGIYNGYLSSATLDNCTLWGNSAPAVFGGGIDNASGTVTLNNCTLSGNSASSGGGIYNFGNATNLVMTNTVVADGVAGLHSGANDFFGSNPKLAPLGNYGGTVQTMVPLYGSPLIDAGSDSVTSFLATDSRGYPRLSGAHVDIGAAEAQYASSINPPVLTNVVQSGTKLQFAFTDAPNVDFTTLTSTNVQTPLSSWTVLGNATQVSSGAYQFTDASATNEAQFYRVVSP